MPQLREETVEMDSGVIIEQESCVSVVVDHGEGPSVTFSDVEGRPFGRRSFNSIIPLIHGERRRSSVEILAEKTQRKSLKLSQPSGSLERITTAVIETPPVISPPVPKEVQVIAQTEIKSSFSIKNYKPGRAVRQMIRRIQGEPADPQQYEVSFKSVSYESIPSTSRDEVVVWLGPPAKSAERLNQEPPENVRPSPEEFVGRAREWL